MEVARSNYIINVKPLLKKLVDELNKKYDYASVLAEDSREQSFQVAGSGTVLTDGNMFGRRGFCVRVHNGKAYAEYASNEITEESIPAIIKSIDEDLAKMADCAERVATPVIEEVEVSFVKSTNYEKHPDEMGGEAILAKLAETRNKILAKDERLMEAICRYSYQQYNKLFLSAKKDLEQNVLWSCTGMFAMASKGQELKQSYAPASVLGGVEIMDRMDGDIDKMVKTAIDLLSSEPMPAGEYDCICDPSVTGMIVHEAFGHGCEMDMFVKDRALAREYVGKQVASPIVTMRDGAASASEVATYFFDDEGVLAHDTLVIDHGILVSGYSDAVSAARLGTNPTGNGRRESVERKTYTRMTNTFFESGTDKLEDMIASVKYGMLLESPSSGMEDPKNWGIQLLVSVAREIKDGKLTGKIFSPVVMSGYVPDLLKSITMMSDTFDICGTGACGKGHKEWAKVSDGGPWIKAKIRLG